ncbi:trimeric intracellular cation channel family protein [Pseudocolwellia sp. AS88]|uniref:trimeric intracellular cation channel family protein n=1 Tax=Pseudocolwellia sp. AS88 TaxID=3063958 RepID=UPI0026EDBCD1|nr:trimeric intracellular cation channel family protein [Pseudocolwellia sp. AS88]MDO7084811.1 trimeric intracellular cation channel family protein [Pseudocolwellia sp. AS88]
MTYLLMFDLIGCAVFALSGAIIAYQKRMDGIGVIVLAAVTAIGGGTVRDLLLGVPVFWVSQPSYIYAIIFSSLVAILWINSSKKLPEKALEIADAFGLALFVVMGTAKALGVGVPPLTAVIMGTITGCFGGMIRDVLANEIPLIFRKELYAACTIAGSSAYVLLLPYLSPMMSAAIAFTIILVLRLMAIRWQLALHVFKFTDE